VFFLIRNFYSAISNLVLGHGGPKQGPTFRRCIHGRFVTLGGGCGQSLSLDIWGSGMSRRMGGLFSDLVQALDLGRNSVSASIPYQAPKIYGG